MHLQTALNRKRWRKINKHRTWEYHFAKDSIGNENKIKCTAQQIHMQRASKKESH
jgi:hypothetical protein